MLYVRFPELIHLIDGSSYPLKNSPLFPHDPTPGNGHFTLGLWVWLYLDSTYKWYHTYLSFSVWLISFYIIPLRSLHALANGRLFFFYMAVWLTKTEDIKNRWQEYTEELYKKDLHNTDNHDGVITHLESDILECEVKKASLWTKLVEVMEFQLSYFKSWKMMLWKCCTQYASKFGKFSNVHRTANGQFSFQS